MKDRLPLIIIGAVVALFFVAAATQGYRDDARQVADAKDDGLSDTKKMVWVAKAEDAVRDKLKDPASAEFSGSFFSDKFNGIPMACGYVNSRNSFGGFTGNQRFVSATTPETTAIEEQVADFEELWSKICS